MDMAPKSNMLCLHHHDLVYITSTPVIGKYLHNICVYQQNPDSCCSYLRLTQNTISVDVKSLLL